MIKEPVHLNIYMIKTKINDINVQYYINVPFSQYCKIVLSLANLFWNACVQV